MQLKLNLIYANYLLSNVLNARCIRIDFVRYFACIEYRKRLHDIHLQCCGIMYWFECSYYGLLIVHFATAQNFVKMEKHNGKNSEGRFGNADGCLVAHYWRRAALRDTVVTWRHKSQQVRSTSDINSMEKSVDKFKAWRRARLSSCRGCRTRVLPHHCRGCCCWQPQIQAISRWLDYRRMPRWCNATTRHLAFGRPLRCSRRVRRHPSTSLHDISLFTAEPLLLAAAADHFVADRCNKSHWLLTDHQHARTSI